MFTYISVLHTLACYYVDISVILCLHTLAFYIHVSSFERYVRGKLVSHDHDVAKTLLGKSRL